MSADKKLLLIGRTSNGKSSTGNSILGDKVFKASMNSQPFTENDIVQGTATLDGTQITVVDGPGIGDASLTDPKDVRQTIALTEKAIGLCSGFDAVLLVLKYGDLFTRQEKDAVHMVKGILGAGVLKKHVVVVVTRGDSFENDMEEDGVSFKVWCREQTGDFADLFLECEQRFVLFNNRTKDMEELGKQRRELLLKVKKCEAYTVEDYQRAKEYRRRLLLSSEHDIMQEENKELIDEINADIDGLDVSGSPDVARRKLTELESKLREHRQKLETKTAGTDVGTHLLNQLTLVAFTVTSKKKLAESYIKLQQAGNDPGTQDTQKQSSGKRSKSGKEKRKSTGSKEASNNKQVSKYSYNISAAHYQQKHIDDRAKIITETTQSGRQTRRESNDRQTSLQPETNNQQPRPLPEIDYRQTRSKQQLYYHQTRSHEEPNYQQTRSHEKPNVRQIHSQQEPNYRQIHSQQEPNYRQIHSQQEPNYRQIHSQQEPNYPQTLSYEEPNDRQPRPPPGSHNGKKSKGSDSVCTIS